MAYTLGACEASFIAGADLSGNQFDQVKLDTTANQVVLASTVGDPAIGVLVEPGAASGDTVKVMLHGHIAKGRAGASVTAGAALMAEGTTGRLITATAGNVVVGHAVEGAADGEIFSYVTAPTYIEPA